MNLRLRSISGLGNVSRAQALVRIRFVDALGTGAWIATSVPILKGEVGLSSSGASFIFAAAGIAAIIAPLTAKWVGRIFTDFRRLLIGINIGLAIIFAVFAASRQYLVALVCIIVGAYLQSILAPIGRTFTYAILSQEQRMLSAASQQVAFNTGFLMGAGYGALMLSALGGGGGSVILLTNALTFASCALLQTGLPSAPGATYGTRERSKQPIVGWFNGFTAAMCFLYLPRTLVSVALPLWLLAGHPGRSYWPPLIIAENAILVIVLQRKIASMVMDVRHARPSILLGAAICGIACILVTVLPGKAWWPVIAGGLACALISVAESLIVASSNVIIFGVIDQRDQYAYQARFALAQPVEQFLGPLGVGVCFIFGDYALWLTSAAAVVLGGVWAWHSVRAHAARAEQ